LIDHCQLYTEAKVLGPVSLWSLPWLLFLSFS